MRALVLDRNERTLKIEGVRREGNVLFRGNGEYAMRGVSWAWGRPAYPRYLFAIQHIPFVGPFVANYLFTRDTIMLIADGVPSTLEPQSTTLAQSLTDEQALSIMEAHSESMSIGKAGMSPMLIVALAAMGVAAIAIVVAFSVR